VSKGTWVEISENIYTSGRGIILRFCSQTSLIPRPDRFDPKPEADPKRKHTLPECGR
jgi:hypothetical protein